MFPIKIDCLPVGDQYSVSRTQSASTVSLGVNCSITSKDVPASATKVSVQCPQFRPGWHDAVRVVGNCKDVLRMGWGHSYTLVVSGRFRCSLRRPKDSCRAKNTVRTI